MIVFDRQSPEISKTILEYKGLIGIHNFKKFEKYILPIKDKQEFERQLFIDNVSFHHALLESAVEIAAAMYRNRNKLESNIAYILNNKYRAINIDIFGANQLLQKEN